MPFGRDCRFSKNTAKSLYAAITLQIAVVAGGKTVVRSSQKPFHAAVSLQNGHILNPCLGVGGGEGNGFGDFPPNFFVFGIININYDWIFRN